MLTNKVVRQGATRRVGTLSPRVNVTGTRRVSHVANASTALPPDVKKVNPVGGRTFLKVEEVKEATQGGILLPDQAQTKQTQGTVMIADADCGFEVGNNVVFSKFAGTELELGGVEHVLLKNEDVVALMPSNDPKDMKPLANGILLEIEDADDKTDGGIFLTGSTKEKPSTGVVLAVGPGKKNEEGALEPVDVTVGSTVLYNKFSGVDFEANDGTSLIVVKDHDIVATLE